MEQDCVNAGTVAKLCDQIQELESERDALKAHVERLIKACELARDNYGKILMTDPPQEAWKANQVTERLTEVIAASPQQSLAERDAEVAMAAIRTALRNLGEPTLTEWSIQIFANEYAQRIKGGDL